MMPAAGALAAFVGTIVAHHAINADLDPADHVISEYANARAGALMSLGFLAWALSLAATSWLALRDRHAPAAARWSLAGCLALAAAGAVLTAVFPTQAVAAEVPAGQPRTTAGSLHDLGSGSATLALVLAAVVALRASLRPAWFRVATAAVLGGSIACNILLLALGDPASGIRQRVLLVAACAWQGALIVVLAGRSHRETDVVRAAVPR